MAESKEGVSSKNNVDNGDKYLTLKIDGEDVCGIGNFHKTLNHNKYGEVDPDDFAKLVTATAHRTTGVPFEAVPPPGRTHAPLTNPTAGLVSDRLVDRPEAYAMPPAPRVQSPATAAEMVELYWMALLRDLPFYDFAGDAGVAAAVADINSALGQAEVVGTGDDAFGKLRPGIDLPGAIGGGASFSTANLFRLGLPGEEIGPMLSQFFVRPVAFGTQTIDARQRPYREGMDYLTDFDSWLKAQNTGKDAHGRDYPGANESSGDYFEPEDRYISTMRDLARFVNKDALHQAYFNAALLLLSGGAMWTPGNPFFPDETRDAGFGALGGPHILALVSEVATRALKTVWFQKWQTHLRLRPEAYGGLAHVQQVGVDGVTRPYGLPAWLFETEAARRTANASRAHGRGENYLLPMAFTPGSPTHPAYGAGHATVAGACVTVLKAYFNMLVVDKDGTPVKDGDGHLIPLPLSTLTERSEPYGPKSSMHAYVTGLRHGAWERMDLGRHMANQLTIEGELNKLAQNVAMGRSMGGVHWRTDNARSLVLGEALAAQILFDIAADMPAPDVVLEPKGQESHQVTFTFRTFARKADGQPKLVTIDRSGIQVDGSAVTVPISAL